MKLEPLLSVHPQTNQQKGKNNNNNIKNNRKQTQQPITTTNKQASKQTKSYTVEYNDIELDFADDTQLQKSTPPNDVQSLTHDLQLCTDDIKAWMCKNRFKLNEDKTEAILFSTP